MSRIFYRADPTIPSVILVGKAEDCHIRITGDDYVSNHHCRLRGIDEGEIWVEDLGSTNGTYVVVDGLAIKVTVPRRLRPGDTLRVGRTSIPWSAQPGVGGGE